MISKCKLTLLLLAAVGAAAQTNTWELGHPDAKLLVGIDLKSLRESAVGQSVRSQWNAQPQQIGPAALALGFLEQIDRIFISSPSLSSSRSKTAGKTVSIPATRTTAANENPPFLLVVEGTLPLQQLLAFLPGTAHRYRDVDVYRGTKAGDANMAMLDARTIVVGDEKSVIAAIDRRGKALPPASDILKRARALASTHDFWIIVEDSLSKFQPAGASLPGPLAAQIASQIKGGEMGLAVRDGFQFELSLATESEAVAGRMAEMLGTQIAQAIQAQGNPPEASEFVNKLHIESEGDRMRVSLAMTGEEFVQQLKAAQALRAAATPAVTRPPAQPPKPATPGKVKIYGLDEGVREIQLTGPQH